jgi:hypothetical protein
MVVVLLLAWDLPLLVVNGSWFVSFILTEGVHTVTHPLLPPFPRSPKPSTPSCHPPLQFLNAITFFFDILSEVAAWYKSLQGLSLLSRHAACII